MGKNLVKFEIVESCNKYDLMLWITLQVLARDRVALFVSRLHPFT
jgi:hypothetical protein